VVDLLHERETIAGSELYALAGVPPRGDVGLAPRLTPS
jgi:hypothetical protein